MRYELRPQDERCELYRIEEDGTEVLLGSDHGEPEDNDFRRDWAWVPGELNRLVTAALHERDEARMVEIGLCETAERLARENKNLQRAVDNLARQIDETRRLKENEDVIAVSQQFQNAGPWIVHGRNGNRQPKIAYWETQEAAEHCAEKVRQVIAEATLPLKMRISELETRDA